MKMTGNTILITGGGSGIGRALAESFRKLGNEVIIAGRRQNALDEVIQANPGIRGLTFDVTDAGSIRDFAQQVTGEFPNLNVVINNAGMMRPEDVKDHPGDLDTAEATITTNLLGPIRLTGALLPHLQKQADATVMMVTSGLAFVPMALTPTYNATKAAIHSYSLALRHQLRATSTRVIELIPPYVQTELLGAHQLTDPRAMPLADFIREVMALLTNDPNATEIVVERCKPLRFAAENGKFAEVFAALSAMV